MLIPIHRGVLPRCSSKFFTRSVVFAIQHEARLPLVPFGLEMTMRQDSLYVTACSFASPQNPEAFTGAPSLGSRHQTPASYEAAWSLPRLDFRQQVVPSLARRAIGLTCPRVTFRHPHRRRIFMQNSDMQLVQFSPLLTQEGMQTFRRFVLVMDKAFGC